MTIYLVALRGVPCIRDVLSGVVPAFVFAWVAATHTGGLMAVTHTDGLLVDGRPDSATVFPFQVISLFYKVQVWVRIGAG